MQGWRVRLRFCAEINTTTNVSTRGTRPFLDDPDKPRDVVEGVTSKSQSLGG